MISNERRDASAEHIIVSKDEKEMAGSDTHIKRARPLRGYMQKGDYE